MVVPVDEVWILARIGTAARMRQADDARYVPACLKQPFFWPLPLTHSWKRLSWPLSLLLVQQLPSPAIPLNIATSTTIHMSITIISIIFAIISSATSVIILASETFFCMVFMATVALDSPIGLGLYACFAFLFAAHAEDATMKPACGHLSTPLLRCPRSLVLTSREL